MYSFPLPAVGKRAILERSENIGHTVYLRMPSWQTRGSIETLVFICADFHCFLKPIKIEPVRTLESRSFRRVSVVRNEDSRNQIEFGQNLCACAEPITHGVAAMHSCFVRVSTHQTLDLLHVYSRGEPESCFKPQPHTTRMELLLRLFTTPVSNVCLCVDVE